MWYADSLLPFLLSVAVSLASFSSSAGRIISVNWARSPPEPTEWTETAPVSRNIANLEPTVRWCILLSEKIHAAVNKAKTTEDLEEIIPGLAILIDASEQPIYRPLDNQMQKKYYGKAKQHTVKT